MPLQAKRAPKGPIYFRYQIGLERRHQQAWITLHTMQKHLPGFSPNLFSASASDSPYLQADPIDFRKAAPFTRWRKNPKRRYFRHARAATAQILRALVLG
jgi:hypothetical protein